MKSHAYCSLIVLILLFGGVEMSSAQKFGYVNTDLVLAGIPEVKQFDSNLEALQNQLQESLQKMVAQLQKEYAIAQQKIERGELSPQQQEQEEYRLGVKQQEIAKFEQEIPERLQLKRRQELQPILDRVNKAISDVANQNGYEFILDQNILLYYTDRIDITQQVKAKLGI